MFKNNSKAQVLIADCRGYSARIIADKSAGIRQQKSAGIRDLCLNLFTRIKKVKPGQEI